MRIKFDWKKKLKENKIRKQVQFKKLSQIK